MDDGVAFVEPGRCCFELHVRGFDWGRITPFFNYLLDIRKAIYTCSARNSNFSAACSLGNPPRARSSDSKRTSKRFRSKWKPLRSPCHCTPRQKPMCLDSTGDCCTSSSWRRCKVLRAWLITLPPCSPWLSISPRFCCGGRRFLPELLWAGNCFALEREFCFRQKKLLVYLSCHRSAP